jgi:very-short-patch-repair endonuclease
VRGAPQKRGTTKVQPRERKPYSITSNKLPEQSDKERTRRTRAARKTEPQSALSHRRGLRATSTKPEQLLWSVLRNRRLDGHRFRRQHSIQQFIVDFVCLEERVVVEADGGYHDWQYEKDQAREDVLKSHGYRVIRFSNEDVITNLEGVAEAIRRCLAAAPSP